MYLVSFDQFHKNKIPSQSPKTLPKPPLPKNRKTKRRVKRKQHSYDKWITFRKKMREADVREEIQIKTIADFLKNFYLILQNSRQ